MIFLRLEEIVEKIKQVSGLEEEEIRKMVKEKQRELYGLVSPEGAAHIVARELGIELVKKEFFKISDLKPGMNDVNLKARVSRIFLREFEKDGERKKVGNVFLVDETGEIRLTLWNEQIESFPAKEGEVVEITNAYTRKNIFGETELRIGNYGNIKIVEDDGSLPLGERAYIFSTINKTIPGKRYQIRAAILHIFNTNIFYEICPECGVIVKNSTCPTHGEIEPEHTMIVNAIIDDGYGNMRAVFFRDIAEKLFGKTSEELFKENINERIKNILGNEYIFYGRVRKNEMFQRKELIIDDFEEVDPEKEAEKLLKDFNSKVD